MTIGKTSAIQAEAISKLSRYQARIAHEQIRLVEIMGDLEWAMTSPAMTRGSWVTFGSLPRPFRWLHAYREFVEKKRSPHKRHARRGRTPKP